MNTRLAESKDKIPVLNLLDLLLVDVARSQNREPDHVPSVKAGNEMFDVLLSDPKYKIFVAEEDGKIFGTATLFLYPVLRRGEYRAQLEELVVVEKLRGQGIGSKLLEAVVIWCRENEIPSMRLNSGLDLTDAHKFYESHGGKFTEKMFRFNF